MQQIKRNIVLSTNFKENVIFQSEWNQITNVHGWIHDVAPGEKIIFGTVDDDLFDFVPNKSSKKKFVWSRIEEGVGAICFIYQRRKWWSSRRSRLAFPVERKNHLSSDKPNKNCCKSFDKAKSIDSKLLICEENRRTSVSTVFEIHRRIINSTWLLKWWKMRKKWCGQEIWCMVAEEFVETSKRKRKSVSFEEIRFVERWETFSVFGDHDVKM